MTSQTWPRLPISEVCELAVDCVNKTAPTADVETPFKMIRTTNVKNGFVDTDDVRFVTEEVFTKWTRRSKPECGDVILTREAPLGEVGRFRSQGQVMLGQRLFHYRANPSRIHPEYLAYVLQSPEVQGRIRSKGFGATVEHARVGDCENLLIPVPELSIQETIGTTLAAYDDLIQNNQRRIKLLEGAARLIYREWFVQLRFPGFEHARIVEGIPEGWSKVTLGDLADVVMGQSPDSKFYNDVGAGLPFHQGVKDFGLRYPTTRMYCSGPGRVAEEGDILVSVRAPVGRLNYANSKMVIGRGLAAVRSKTGNQGLLFQLLKGFFFKEDIIGSGAIYAAVTRSEFLGIELLSPPPSVAEEFGSIIDPIEKQIRNLGESNERLVRARDLLLPRLMSGEIEV
ncbi:MAG TPA: restriction endonuclease subunit S [Fimbriimonadaceae bacterium]|nr:restriction endonuclease subunit S [Fimbriimonadaceae bacterium]HRJ34105.1 restriction endonuclease subunit S [Fimbriimonadaceae bacterium]